MIAASLGASGASLRVLCLGAHCDDLEIGCGGTILRLLAERPGSTIRWEIFAGDAKRVPEARSSAGDFLAAARQAQVEINSFRESYFPFVGAQIKDRFEQIKAELKPDLIFTHRTEDLHQDHRLIGELTWNTFRDHLIAEYEIPKYEGDLGQPNVFLPLSTAIAQRKIELVLRHFRSQAGRRWFRAETFESLMRLRGLECNAAEGYAEALYVRKLVL